MFRDDVADEDVGGDGEMALDGAVNLDDVDGDIEFQDDWLDDDDGEVAQYLKGPGAGVRSGTGLDVEDGGGLREMGTLPCFHDPT